MDFRKAGFGLLGDLLGRLSGRLPCRVKGARDSWWIFKDNLLKAQNQSIAVFRKSSKHGRRPAWISEELFMELKHKKKVQRKWKQLRATQEAYRDIASACRDRIRKFRAQLELTKKRDVKGNLSVL